jgi:hypothetical protein
MSNPLGAMFPASLISRQHSSKPVLRYINNARCQWWDRAHNTDTCGVIPCPRFPSRVKANLQDWSTQPITRASYVRPVLLCRSRISSILSSMSAAERAGCFFWRPSCPSSEFWGSNLRLPSPKPRGKISSADAGIDSAVMMFAVFTADATEYELPLEPAVLYFANPFFPAVMNQVIRNIEQSLRRSLRDLLILFVGLQFRRGSSFGAHPGYERLCRDRYFDLYRRRPRKRLNAGRRRKTRGMNRWGGQNENPMRGRQLRVPNGGDCRAGGPSRFSGRLRPDTEALQGYGLRSL